MKFGSLSWIRNYEGIRGSESRRKTCRRNDMNCRMTEDLAAPLMQGTASELLFNRREEELNLLALVRGESDLM